MKIGRPLDKGHIAIGTSLLGTAEKASPWRYHRVTSKCTAIFFRHNGKPFMKPMNKKKKSEGM